MTKFEADKLKEKIINDCPELKGFAFIQVMNAIDEQTENKCIECFGAANNDCAECEVTK